MGRTYFVPAPGKDGLENRIARHIYENLEGEKENLDWLCDKGSARSPSEFYSHQKWVKHQGMVLNHFGHMSHDLTEEDTLFFADAFFPGLELLELRFPKAKKIGFVHGSSSIPGDLFEGVDWAWRCEWAWFGNIYNQLLVQTRYARDMLQQPDSKILVVGSPFNPEEWDDGTISKRDIDVVWPFRPSPDKGVGDFISVALILIDRGKKVVWCTPEVAGKEITWMHKAIPGLEVVTGCTGKRYLEVLRRSKYVLSTAVQETWGYAVMEAVAAGASPMVPDRACYPELYTAPFRYVNDATPQQIADRILDTPLPHPTLPKRHIRGRIVNGLFQLR